MPVDLREAHVSFSPVKWLKLAQSPSPPILPGLVRHPHNDLLKWLAMLLMLLVWVGLQTA